ncbi:hypothetical protein [uncultured Nostoc sp.]|uniref:hypothetical protein n=1 Tax=uncultured Nostoc sp. TaxID=340711 RepID=UPI002608B254|nr:hypothetical protein [uncultured Nostoc sp.]
MPTEELLNFILQSANNNLSPGLNIDMEWRFEVELAWKELQTLDPELEASLRSLINQDDYK